MEKCMKKILQRLKIYDRLLEYVGGPLSEFLIFAMNVCNKEELYK